MSIDPTTRLYAARGLVQSLNEEQRATLFSLLQTPGFLSKSVEDISEQIVFEGGGSKPTNATDDVGPLILAGLFYALDRSSTAPAHMAETVRRQWDRLDDATQDSILKKVEAEIERRETRGVGMDIDLMIWKSLADFCANQTNKPRPQATISP